VPRDDRVRCQADGCNHPVFRRIHLVRENTVIRVYGSECFKRLFTGESVSSSTPRYTTSDGRELTEVERQLLIENTERLVRQFEEAYQADARRRAALVSPLPPRPESTSPPTARVITPAMRAAAEAKAKQIVRAKYGVNPELPGWYGLVMYEMRRILGEDAVQP
jgi:hypothetical protein